MAGRAIENISQNARIFPCEFGMKMVLLTETESEQNLSPFLCMSGWHDGELDPGRSI